MAVAGRRRPRLATAGLARSRVFDAGAPGTGRGRRVGQRARRFRRAALPALRGPSAPHRAAGLLEGAGLGRGGSSVELEPGRHLDHGRARGRGVARPLDLRSGAPAVVAAAPGPSLPGHHPRDRPVDPDRSRLRVSDPGAALPRLAPHRRGAARLPAPVQGRAREPAGLRRCGDRGRRDRERPRALDDIDPSSRGRAQRAVRPAHRDPAPRLRGQGVPRVQPDRGAVRREERGP